MENEKYEILLDFEIQIDRLISTSWPDQVFDTHTQKKLRTWRIVKFAVPADHKIKLKEVEKRDK